jgi:hypothetical protein
MARYTIPFSTAFALVAATAKTVVRVNAAAGNAVALRRICITDGLAGSTDTGILGRVLYGGTDGTGTAVTPVPTGRAAACDATAKTAYTVEPTASPTESGVRFRIAAGGGVDLRFEHDDFPRCAASGAIAVELTAPEARASGIVTGFITIEEI